MDRFIAVTKFRRSYDRSCSQSGFSKIESTFLRLLRADLYQRLDLQYAQLELELKLLNFQNLQQLQMRN